MSNNNLSSVPSGLGQSQMLNQSRYISSDYPNKHQDSILMYCSYFTYCANQQKIRRDTCNTNPDSICQRI